MPQPDQQSLADMVVLTIKATLGTALAPVLERLSALETHLKKVSSVESKAAELGDRLLVIETKSAAEPPPEHLSDRLAPLLERLAAVESKMAQRDSAEKSLFELRDRMVALETKSAILTAPPDDGTSNRIAALEAKSLEPSPVLERMADAERVLTELRERIVATETKSASLLKPQTELDAFVIRLAAVENRLAAERDTAPIERRIEALETRPEPVPVVSSEDITSIRDRLKAVETKADGFEARLAAPNPFSAALEKTDRTLADLSKDFGSLRERVAVAEVKTGVPGPAGPAGKDGANGADGIGFDDLIAEQTDERTFAIKAARGDRVKQIGTVTFPVQLYRGVWLAGQEYAKGDCVTWGGSEWHCNEATSAKPGEGDGVKAWTLKVKRGRDGRDGKDAPGALPVVTVGRG